ncbi:MULTISPECIES: hypothetical protein [unclassified Rhizobacter]|uniref:hypothetical protein n=1 Tax=unclassified Rhizobacter TaxID=2640088 RepID=UPI000A4A9EE1|nr:MULTISPECIES: hypothetical protein [unclassified Rhizobacter]
MRDRADVVREPLWRGILRFGGVLCLANAPFWILGRFLFFDRAVVVVDVALAALASGLGAVVGVVVLCVLWLADAITSASKIYYFGSVGSFIDAGRFLLKLDLLAFLSGRNLAVLLLFSLCAAGCYCLMRRRLDWRAVVLVTLPIVLLDVLNGSSYLSIRSSRITYSNIAASPLLTVGRSLTSLHEPGPIDPVPAGESAQDVVDLAGWAAAHPSRSVLFVVVESLGIHRDPATREWLRSALIDADLSRRYDVVERELPFHDATVAGELRSLCGLAGDYRSLSQSVAARCLPAKLAAIGWETIGLHGFSGNVFDRREWWPMIGLQRIFFAEELLRPESARCGGAFRGSCDADLVRQAGIELQQPRRLVYLLTLNSHLPLALGPIPPDNQSRCDNARAGRDVCQLLTTHRALLSELRNMLQRLDNAPAVVVVGDHAPPFVDTEGRNQYAADRVPMLLLLPR